MAPTSTPWNKTDKPKVSQTSRGVGPGTSSRSTAAVTNHPPPGPTGSVTIPTRSTPALLITSITFMTVP